MFSIFSKIPNFLVGLFSMKICEKELNYGFL